MKTQAKAKQVSIVALTTLTLISLIRVLGQSAPQPVLSIRSTGTNQIVLTITNGVTYTNYEIYRAPVLNDPAFPFTLCALGTNGQTNFIIPMFDWSMSLFKAKLPFSTNGIPDWMLADPNNPSLGPLSITIDSPLNGGNVN